MSSGLGVCCEGWWLEITSCQIVHHVRWTKSCHLQWGASLCCRATVPPCCYDPILQVLTRSVRAISHPLAQPTDHQGDHWSRNLWVRRRLGSGTSAHTLASHSMRSQRTIDSFTHSLNLWVWRRFGSGTSAHACTRLAQHAFTTHH